MVSLVGEVPLVQHATEMEDSLKRASEDLLVTGGVMGRYRERLLGEETHGCHSTAEIPISSFIPDPERFFGLERID